jgi:uncharacterized protein YaiE (UPF0345 family)
MKARTIVLTLLLCVLGAVALFAQDVQMGTWKLNSAKSRFSAGAMRYRVVVFQAAGDEITVTVGGTDAHRKPTRNEWRGKFDGKDYPVVGDSREDTRSYTIVDDHTLGFNTKKGGEITISGRIVVSGDGRSRTVTTTGTDSRGRKFTSIAVYEKQ